MKKVVLVLFAAAVVGVGWFVWSNNSSSRSAEDREGQQSFDKQQYSLDDPASPWVIVNKRRPLKPASYTPADLVVPDVPLRLAAGNEEMQLSRAAATAIESLVADAEQVNISLMLSSAYRSYSYQQGLYNTYVRQQGQTEADTQSARPGHSEHQTGFAVDVEPATRECEIEQCFGALPEGKWVAANAYKYGFVIRYPDGKEATTGYIYEPWHLRYVGKSLAKELHRQNNPTLEEFFGLGPAPDYQ